MSTYTSTHTYKEHEYPVNLLLDIFRSNPLPDHLTENAPEAVKHILDTLPERERAAISLRYQQCMSSSDIGASLGISRRNALFLIQKGIRLLRHPARYKLLISQPVIGE